MFSSRVQYKMYSVQHRSGGRSPVLSHRCGVVFTRVIAPVRCCVYPCFAQVQACGQLCFGLVPTMIYGAFGCSNSHKFHQSFWFLEVGVGEFSDVPRISKKPQKAHPQTQMSLSTKNDDFLTNRF